MTAGRRPFASPMQELRCGGRALPQTVFDWRGSWKTLGGVSDYWVQPQE
jgi:hypothetical protein